MSEWLDITRPIDETLITWPGRAQPQSRWEKRLADGNHCNVSFWQMSAHSGTHMDAPLHFIANGKSIDQISPDVFMGPCEVLDLCALQAATLDENIARPYVGVKRILIRTSHSQRNAGCDYLPHEALATDAAAAALVAGGLTLVGTDRLSVDDSNGKNFSLHNLLLGAGCVIIEGLQLADVSAGSFWLSASPLRFTGMEASPVRAFLRRSGS